jgi:hypothetical protein
MSIYDNEKVEPQIGLFEIFVEALNSASGRELSESPRSRFQAVWPAPGSEDIELGVLMEPEVRHGETEVYTRVQA